MNEERKYSMKKLGAILKGPAVGMAPPRVQMNHFKGDWDLSALSSATSRITNLVYGVAAAFSHFIVDIDPTPENLLTKAGGIVLANTLGRELFAAADCLFSTSNRYLLKPWGDPLLSMIDARNHPEWYHPY